MNIIYNGDMAMFKKLAQQLKCNSKINSACSTNPISEEFLAPKSVFLKNLSRQALDLYERQTDIKNFSKLVLSDPENTSHNKMVEDLFEDGVADPFVDDKLEMLANNQKFLRDLGLM